MYHKIKNTLAGLGFVAAFIGGGLLFSDPVPARAAVPMPVLAPAATAQAEATLAMAMVRTRLQTVMPYYSFGATLPRRQQES